MKTKAFMLLLVGVLALGGGLGGAFAGGMALGKGQREAQVQPTQPGSQLSNQQQLDKLRQQIQSGQLSQEQLQQIRQQFQGQFGARPGQGFSGRNGLSGTIEKTEGNVVTVNTPQGPLRVTVSADTTIQTLVQGTVQDLATGLRVTVLGQHGEDGTVTATAILTAPEGVDGFFGGGFFGERQQQNQQSP